MAGVWGLDYEEVVKFSKAVQADSDKIEAIAKTLGAKVQSLNWKGPDATFFKNNWDNGYEKTLKSVARLLDAVAKDAKQNAEAQKAAST